MSFWPFCCKPPQVHSLSLQAVPSQFCTTYSFEPANGRPVARDAYGVAGSRSGRAVASPLAFRSACDVAGVSEDGNLYVWGAGFVAALEYRHSTSDAVEKRDDSYLDKEGAFAASTVTHGVFQVGSEGDWDFVSQCGRTVVAVKADGSMWSLGEQLGVDFEYDPNFQLTYQTRTILRQAFRAKLSSPISSIRTDFAATYGFGLPVWFTAKPASQPVIQKLRMWPREIGSGSWEPDVAVANGEPGSGATVSASFLAKIDTGAITGVSIQSAGSGYPANTIRTVSIAGHEGSGSGADVRAVINNSGQVASVFILNPGDGYKHPVTATLSGGSGATLSVTPPKRVQLTSGGSGYKSVPAVTVSPDEGETAPGDGTSIRVTEMSRCAVESFQVTSPGQGYTFATAVEEKTGATATAFIGEGGSIVSWSLTSGGAANHSPLDEEPLSVTVTGDGTGASASAVPVGSSILKIDVESNPESWTRSPVISFQGGGGSGAAAVVEGIIGRLDVSLESGGSGYTKTSSSERQRTQFCPCVTVPNTAAVGGRVVGGSVIVGEAVLSGSHVVRIDEDAQEFCNPNNSPYREGEETFTSQQDSLARHRKALADLTVESGGVVHPFVRDIPAAQFAFVQPEDRQAHASQCLSWYLRGPGHVRYPVGAQYIPAEDVYRLTLASPIQASAPPALCLEISARPHKFELYASQTANDRFDGTACWRVTVLDRPKAIFEQWWAGRSDGVFTGGTVTALGNGGATTTYRVLDGELIQERMVPAVSAFDGISLPEGTIQGLSPYLGPMQEVVLEDPVRSWSQPSSAQRVHFIFRAEQGSPARGLASAAYSPSLLHPILGSIQLVESGDGYTEEPEPMIRDRDDPFPVDSGMSGCTSAGSARYVETIALNLAFVAGEMHWWGYNSAVLGYVAASPPEFIRSSTAAERYAWRMKNRASPGLVLGNTCKPTPVGGHLRFAASGELRGTGQENSIPQDAMGSGLWRDFLRLPRPAYGNRLPSKAAVFSPFPDVKVPTGINEADLWDAEIALVSGEQISPDGDRHLMRYRAWPVQPADHGAGYSGGAEIQYIGPGLSPHTFSVAASVIPNGLAEVGANGLLRDSEQKWRMPFFSDPAVVSSVLTYTGRTVSHQNVPTDAPTGCTSGDEVVTTVVELPPIEARLYDIVVRSPGSGYREPDDTSYWKSLGGGRARITISGVRARWLRGGSGSSTSFSTPTSPFSEQEAMETSSYGGLPPRRLSVYSTTLPQVTVSGGGSGAIVEVIQVPQSQAKPFAVWCDDQIDSSVGPCPDETVSRSGLAAANGGLLRVVRDGRLYRPEAFSESLSVTSIRAMNWVSNFVSRERYPYAATVAGTTLDHDLPSHVFRDGGGVLWALHNTTNSTTEYPANKFWLGARVGEAIHPIAVSPLAIAATSVGYGYDYPVSVSVTQPTGVAKGSATIDGKVVGVAVTDGGSGYETPPAVVFEGGVAQGVATIAGPVSKVTVTSGGSGYRQPPRVRFSSPGMGAEARATLDGGSVSKVAITSGGSYRQSPQVFFDPVSDVESVFVTSGGSGYYPAPDVYIDGGGGSGATAVAKISCSVTEIVLTSGGQGYTLPPPVEIVGDGTGAVAVAVLDFGTGQVSRINVVSGGSGYTTPPTVQIAGSATAQAKIAGYVSEIVLTARGKDFEAPPQVIITGGGGLGAQAAAVIAAPGSGAAATATINGSVIAVEVTSPGAGLQKPPRVSCNHPPTAVGKANAVLKATILGRPTAVTVTSPGAGYVLPLYAANDPPGAKRRTPSRITRRPTVFAKGSFSWASTKSASVSDAELPLMPHHKTPRYSHGFLNTYPALGIAEISGGNSDSGGSVSSVSLPNVVVAIDVTNPGQGYAPGASLPIRYQGGVLDSRFRLLGDSLPSVGAEVATAYVGHDGRVAGVRSLTSPDTETSLLGLPLGLRAFASPPTLSVDGTGGAQVVARLGHPLECYYAPQVLFDGSVEAEADVSLAIAGASVQRGGLLPAAYHGGGSGKPFLVARRDRSLVLRNRFSQSGGTPWSGGLLYNSVVGDDPDLRICVTGAVAGLSLVRLEPAPATPAAFFSSPPSIAIEDEAGTGAIIQPSTLPSSGAVSEGWIGLATVSQPGAGYTLAARVRLTGGRPLAWDNPASVTAVVSQGGTVASVSIASQGKGYSSPPRVFIVGDGAGAAAVIDEDDIDPETGSITAIRLVSGGSGYTSASVVLVDREAAAERSARVAEMIEGMRERYSILLEDCAVERAYIPPELRKSRTTVSARGLFQPQEFMPPDIHPAPYSSLFKGDFEVSGNRLHPVYSSDGYVEYFRVEGHFGEPPVASPVVTVDATSETVPLRPATAIAVVPKSSKLLSGLVANISDGGKGFLPYQLQEPDYTDASQTFDVEDSLAYPQDIVGSGTVVKQGAGTLALTGNNTFTGMLDVKAGVVVATSPPSVADIDIATGASVMITDGGIHSGRVTGGGTLVKEGDGDLRLSDTSDFTGDIFLLEGSLSGVVNLSEKLEVYSGATLSAEIILDGGTLIFDLDEPGEFSGRITGAGTVVKRGAGRLEFNGEADFTGDFLFEPGNGAMAGNSTFSDSVTLSGASLEGGSLSGATRVSGLLRVSSGASLSADVILAGVNGRIVFDIESGTDSQYSGSITGDGTVIKQGEGRLEFSGEAAFSGQFDFEEGTLDGEIVAGANTSLVVAGELLADVELNGNGVYWTLYSAAVYDGVISGEGFVLKAGPGLLGLSAKSTYTGDFIAKGPFSLLDGGGLIADIDLDGAAEVSFDLSSSYEYEGVIKGDGAVIKRGGGELTLVQASTFLGLLDVEEGSLVVKAGIDTPAPFESATYTPDSLTFEFSGNPTGLYTIFNAVTSRSYPVVTLEGTTATGVYNSSISRLAIN